jgi:hypothetical protein
MDPEETPDFSALAIDADMGNPRPLLSHLQSRELLSHQDRLMIAWVIERACLKTGRSITDVGDGGAAGKCAAYLASLGRAERRRSSASARLPDHEREMIAQKALDLLSSHFSAVSNMTAETVLSIRSVDHNSSVVTLSMNTCGRPSTRSNNSRRGREQKRKRLALASRNRSITWSRRLAASAAPAGTATTGAAACAATARARGSGTCSRRARPAPQLLPRPRKANQHQPSHLQRRPHWRGHRAHWSRRPLPLLPRLGWLGL